jgi:hypothetical protein
MAYLNPYASHLYGSYNPYLGVPSNTATVAESLRRSRLLLGAGHLGVPVVPHHASVAESLRRSRLLLGAGHLPVTTNLPVSLATQTSLRRS